jgi:hypothetical protein
MQRYPEGLGRLWMTVPHHLLFDSVLSTYMWYVNLMIEGNCS